MQYNALQKAATKLQCIMLQLCYKQWWCHKSEVTP